jgi:hypothetical protein
MVTKSTKWSSPFVIFNGEKSKPTKRHEEMVTDGADDMCNSNLSIKK